MRILIALALAVLPAPLLAQAAPDFALPAGRYTSDKDHTQLLWSVSHMGFSAYSGRFTGLAGTLQLDPAKPASSTLTFTVDTDSIDAFNSVLTTELKGDKWFDAAKFPKATFQSTSVTVAGNSAKVAGNLTLHGVTKPVTLDVRMQGKGMHPMTKVETVGFAGTTTIKRSEFGIATFLPMIADEVTLTFNGEFHLAK